MRFIIAGSGHIAGVINPPEAKKYQYWTNDAYGAVVNGSNGKAANGKSKAKTAKVNGATHLEMHKP